MKLRVPQLRKLLYFMEERQRIYLARQSGEPWPWTQDPILQRYRMCNVYRTQDRETKWLQDNWLTPYANHPNLWFAVCMFRQINWSPTLAEIGFPQEWNPRKVLTALKKREERGEKIYTSAYLIPSRGEKRKICYTVRRVLNPLWKSWRSKLPPWISCYPGTPTLEISHEWLLTHYGFGPFISYEVVTDLRHTHWLRNAPDINTWANPGPGAKRGICRLLDVPLKHPISKPDQLLHMQHVYDFIFWKRDKTILPTLEMRDIEHSCCEFDKMERAKERLKSGKTIGLEHFRPPKERLV